SSNQALPVWTVDQQNCSFGHGIPIAHYHLPACAQIHRAALLCRIELDLADLGNREYCISFLNSRGE
ncbi:MAG: hypothetical protein V4587_14015, partial [Acidobacteriota bacterium]